MKIGLLSDTHNHFANTFDALSVMRAEGVQRIIHCGDLTRIESAEWFRDFSFHLAQGNNDFDSIGLSLTIQEFGVGSSFGVIYTAEIDGKRIAAIHGHQLAQLSSLIHCGHYDYVFHGHTHRFRDEIIGNTRVINPGALGGIRRDARTFCILEVVTGDLSVHKMS